MRLDDFTDYFRLKKIIREPWAFVRMRTRQIDAPEYKIEFVDGGHFTIRSAPQDRHIFHRIFARDEYRLDGIAPDSWETVIDVGGHIGIFAVRASKIARRVLAYEPVSESFELLKKNVETSGCKNVQTFRFAVGKGGPVKIYTSKNPSANSSFLPESLRSGEETVQGITLDEIFRSNNVSQCDLLKLDCEGAEYDILYGCGEETLRKIRRIRLEFHSVPDRGAKYSGRELAECLKASGFAVEFIQSKRHTEKGYLFCEK